MRHVRSFVVVARNMVVGVIVGRIATIVVMISVSVVMRIHWRHVVRTVRAPTARRRRRHHRTIAIVVVAVGAGTVVVVRTRSDVNDHPRLVVITVPAEAHRLEVFEGGEAVELVAQFIVWHHRVKNGGIRTVGWDTDRNPSDTARTYFHVLVGVAVTVIRIKVDIEIATISVISDILNIIVDGDRIGVIGQHWL